MAVATEDLGQLDRGRDGVESVSRAFGSPKDDSGAALRPVLCRET
jgi:hypothetical protein